MAFNASSPVMSTTQLACNQQYDVVTNDLTQDTNGSMALSNTYSIKEKRSDNASEGPRDDYNWQNQRRESFAEESLDPSSYAAINQQVSPENDWQVIGQTEMVELLVELEGYIQQMYKKLDSIDACQPKRERCMQ